MFCYISIITRFSICKITLPIKDFTNEIFRKMELDDIMEVICEASIYPLAIYDEYKILKFNSQYSELFELGSIDTLDSHSITDFFVPSFETLHGEFYKKLEQVQYIKHKCNNNIVFSPAKIKQWIYGGKTWFTVSAKEKNSNDILSPTKPCNIEISKEADENIVTISQILDCIPYELMYMDKMGSQT